MNVCMTLRVVAAKARYVVVYVFYVPFGEGLDSYSYVVIQAAWLQHLQMS